MFGTTMMLTIGQALDRVKRDQTPIRVHVAGEWISGLVMNTDSQGVVIADENGDVCVLRMDAITCLRIPGDHSDRADRIPTQASGSIDRQLL